MKLLVSALPLLLHHTLASVYASRSSMQPLSYGLNCLYSSILYEIVQPCNSNKKGATGAWHAHTHRVLLEGTSDQAQANDFLWLGNEQLYMPYTSHIKQTHTHTHTHSTHTHTHLTSGYCVCAKRACMCSSVCVCMSASSASTERSLPRPDHGLFLARPPGLRHLQRERKRTQ